MIEYSPEKRLATSTGILKSFNTLEDLHHCTFHTLGNRPLLGDLSVEWQRYYAQRCKCSSV
jgi:hypothetical protein